MKRISLSLLVFLFLGFAATAQTEKGNWLVGGNLGLNTAKNDTKFSFSPSAGYFFLHNFAAGAKVNLSFTKVVDTKTTDIGIGPFARYYFGTMNIRPFADVELSFDSRKTTIAASSKTKNSNSFFIGGGLAAFINRNVAIEGLAGYKRTSFAKDPSTGGFNLSIGFQVYLSNSQVQDLKEGKL
jgi:hypothetical protein